MIKCQDNIFFMKQNVCQVSRGFSESLSQNKTNPLHINIKKITIFTECVMLHLILVCICVEESVSLWSYTISIASEEKYHIEKLYN